MKVVLYLSSVILLWHSFQETLSAVFSNRYHRRLPRQAKFDSLLQGSTNRLEERPLMSGNQELLTRIEESLLRGLNLCIITRGAPGRGKTTIAEEIVRHCTNNGKFNAEISSADDYMIDSLGWLCIFYSGRFKIVVISCN